MSEMIKKATRASYGETLVELAEKYPNLVVLDADLAHATNTLTFAKAYPDRFINCGIAEGNMMGVAAGLAASGMLPFASSFAMFAAGRAFEQIRNSIGYPHLNVKIAATHAGISVGEDGATHQCCEDIALMRSIPGMVVMTPADDVEAKAMVRAAAEYQGPCYIRLSRLATPVFNDPETYKFEWGKGVTLKNGNDVTIVACGLMVYECLQAANILSGYGINARVINLHTIKPIDKQLMIQAARETGRIVTVEEHNTIGGLGDAVQNAIRSNPCPMNKIGVHDVFGHSGPAVKLLEQFGLCAEAIANRVREVL